jgi:hypothetical protein
MKSSSLLHSLFFILTIFLNLHFALSIQSNSLINERTLLHTNIKQKAALDIVPLELDQDHPPDLPQLKRITTTSGRICELPFTHNNLVHFDCVPEKIKNLGGKGDVTLFWCLITDPKTGNQVKDYCLSSNEAEKSRNLEDELRNPMLRKSEEEVPEMTDLLNTERNFEKIIASDVVREIVFSLGPKLKLLDLILKNCLMLDSQKIRDIQALGEINFPKIMENLTLSCLKNEILRPELMKEMGTENFEKIIAIFQRVYSINKNKMQAIQANKRKLLSFRFLSSGVLSAEQGLSL